MKYINSRINYLKEQTSTNLNLVDFESFPPNILKTLKNEYISLITPFDWNEKQDEFDNPQDFKNWYSNYQKEQFVKEIDKLIKYTSEDIEAIKSKKLAEEKLDKFEDLIIPSLGSGVLSPALTKFQQDVIMNPNATIEDIEKGFEDSKDIIDKDGSIDKRKTEMSDIFTGGYVNLAEFERFVERNPEYQGAFDDWKELLDEYTKPKELHAFRNSTSIDDIQELHNFLIEFKKKL